MKNAILKALTLTATLAVSTTAHATTVTMGPGGFDDGWATSISYDDAAPRGSAHDRDNGLNALGAADGRFFELGFGGWADFTFGTSFNASAEVYEVTFGRADRWPEAVEILVGAGGTFTSLGTISNVEAQGGGTLTRAFSGRFDTVRLIDRTDPSQFSSRAGGFDVDAVRVAPVPLPAGAVLLLTGLGCGALLRRKKA